MAAPLRFGVEFEFHGITLTFIENGTGNTSWWANGGGQWEDSMIAHNPVLVPVDQSNGFPNWEAEWGFKAVGDDFNGMNITQGAVNRVIGSCVLELATPAMPVDNTQYVSDQRYSVTF
jgi:hypothetical protein